MRVFLAGATGVVGRRLVPLLQNAGHEVTAAVRSSVARAELTTKGVRAIEANLFDPGAVSRAVAGQDVVVNLATHIPDSSRMFLPWAWRENDRPRRVASAILVDASLASTVSRFVQESFAPVYPDSGSEWIDERMSLSPLVSIVRSSTQKRRQNGSPRRGAPVSCCDSEVSTDTTRFRPPR